MKDDADLGQKADQLAAELAERLKTPLPRSWSMLRRRSVYLAISSATVGRGLLDAFVLGFPEQCDSGTIGVLLMEATMLSLSRGLRLLPETLLRAFPQLAQAQREKLLAGCVASARRSLVWMCTREKLAEVLQEISDALDIYVREVTPEQVKRTFGDRLAVSLPEVVPAALTEFADANLGLVGFGGVCSFLDAFGAMDQDEIDAGLCEALDLPFAAFLGDRHTAQRLLLGGADPNARDERGWMPLHIAVTAGSRQVVRLLIESGADVNVEIDRPGLLNGQSPLHLAAMSGDEHVVRLLLANGAQPGRADGVSGEVALHTAASFGHANIVQLLLELGLEVDVRDSYGCTALHSAALEGEVQSARVLLERGANVNAKDELDAEDGGGATPLHEAATYGHTEMVALLIGWQAELSVQDKNGETPLKRAIRLGEKAVAQLLVAHGAV